MSIINSNRHQARISFHVSVPRKAELSKRELYEMLADAARNTAAESTDNETVPAAELRRAG